MKKLKTLDLVYMAFYIALSIALNFLNQAVPLIQMQNGGSVEYALVALIVASYHLGWRKATMVALISYLLEVMLGFHTYMLNPMQVFFDYIFPICIMGFASIMPKIFKKETLNICFGIFMVMLLKYFSHVISGALFYASYSGHVNGSVAGWIFSFGYNATYCIPTAILALAIVPILVKRLKRIRNDFVSEC